MYMPTLIIVSIIHNVTVRKVPEFCQTVSIQITKQSFILPTSFKGFNTFRCIHHLKKVTIFNLSLSLHVPVSSLATLICQYSLTLLL